MFDRIKSIFGPQAKHKTLVDTLIHEKGIDLSAEIAKKTLQTMAPILNREVILNSNEFTVIGQSLLIDEEYVYRKFGYKADAIGRIKLLNVNSGNTAEFDHAGKVPMISGCVTYYKPNNTVVAQYPSLEHWYITVQEAGATGCRTNTQFKEVDIRQHGINPMYK
jgi:hypothetical protein